MLAVFTLVLLQPPAVRDFTPVLLPDGADPWVARGDDGTYYLLVTTARDITIRRAKSLAGLAAGASKTVWTPPADGPTSKNVWAPELHRLGGKWYVYFAADDGENKNHRLYVLENPDPDPFAGRFTLKGKLADSAADRWAIDGTVFTVRGKLYLAWSGWDGEADGQQNLYVAPLANPWTLAGPRVKVAEPTHPWERVGAPPAVLEGPQALLKGDAVHLIYSASGSWTDDYCLGRLTLKAGGDPLDPASWVKHPTPVFRAANGIAGPGHACFATSPDGKDDWLLYHAARFPGSGWERQVRLQPFTWADGIPAFGEPRESVTLPGGEPPRWRFLAAGGKVNVNVPTAGEYALSLCYRTPTDADEAARIGVRAGGRGRTWATAVPTRGRWSVVALRLTLAAGDNPLSLVGPEVAAVDVWRP